MITYNGQSSDAFGIQIIEGVTFESPSRQLESTKVPGRDGQLMTGDGTLNNVKKSFPFIIKNRTKDIAQITTDISNWLKKDALWHELEFSGDANYIYQAIAIDEYKMDRVLSWYGKGTLDFEVKPYKFLKTGLTEITLGATITNPTQRQARPKITIKGTGNITLKIGQSTWTLRNVDQGIVIDTLLDTVTSLDGSRPAWDKITSYPLPTINPGQNAVTVTGTTTEIKIIPRWEVIVG